MKSAETEPQTDLARELCKAGDNCEKKFTAVLSCVLVGDDQAHGFLDVKVPRWIVFSRSAEQDFPRWTGEDARHPLSAGKKIGAWPIGTGSLTFD